MSTDSSRTVTVTDLARGFFGRCPHCGKGHLFGRFLKVNDRCSVCGEDLHHQRADDFPAYVVMALVGHLVVPTELYTVVPYNLPDWTVFALWLPSTVLLALALLQPVKGAIVALQWRMGMHGFAHRLAAH